VAVTLRLKRCGSKGRPFYRVVAMDSRKKRNGRAIEVVGTYNPMDDPPSIRLNLDRLEHWYQCGAQASETVQRLVRQQKRMTQADA